MNRYLIENINGEEYAIPNTEYWEQKKQELYELLLKRSNIPEFYKTIDFNNYVGDLSRKNVEEINRIAQNIKNEKLKDVSLYLWSTINTSQKTACMCNYGKECIRQGLKVQFMTFGTFVNFLMKNQGFRKDDDAEKELTILRNADIILLDDCFDSKKSLLWNKDESRALIISEIDTFFRIALSNHKRFCITSNYPIEVVQENYGISLFELLDRNFKTYQFLDSVKEVRKNRLNIENLF